MVRPRGLKPGRIHDLLYRSGRSAFVSNYSTLNSRIGPSLNAGANLYNIPGGSGGVLAFSVNYAKRDLHISRSCFKALDPVTHGSQGGHEGYHPGLSELPVADTAIAERLTLRVPDLGLNQTLPAAHEAETFLDHVKAAVAEHAEAISLWLKTNKHAHVKDVDDRVLQLLRNADRFAAIHGLLLADVAPEDLKAHVSAAKTMSSLFTPQFMKKKKKKLYGDSDLPLLARPRAEPEHAQEEEALNHKRQQLIEKLSFSEALESATSEASSLLDFQHPSELSSLSRTCAQWIQDIAQFVKRDRERGGNFVVPLELEEELLAATTVKTVLQSMCFPTYSFDAKGNRGGLIKKKIQQSAGNQALISHLAIKLGDEVGKLYAKMHAERKEAETQEAPEDDHEEFIEVKSNEEGENKVVVKSSLSAVVEPLKGDADKNKNWNSAQSAAVGGYLLNALIKSCKVELDLETALKQYLASYAQQQHNASGRGRAPDEARPAGAKENRLTVVDRHDRPLKHDKIDIIMRFLNVIKKSRFNESRVEVEAFRHALVRQGLKTFGVLEMRESCMLQLRDLVAKSLVALAALPMVCRPRRWTNATSGGSLLLKHNFVRGSRLADVRVYDLEGVFDVVNKFSQVPWVINREMLRLVKRINDTPNDIPLKQFIPYNPNGLKAGAHAPPTALGGGAGETKLGSDELSELSLFLRRIKIADSFANEPRIYLPLNIDFRGRMYPLSPYLNHMNDDMCRSLLLFGERRRIGLRGLFWLKVHISNMYGNDKSSFWDRVKWVDEHTAIVRDLVASPFADFSQNFWAKAEKPFQFFAACAELVRALDAPNPLEYATNIPIQQDGTCNGLQHYAALGRDAEGAKYVNLVDAERPQDLYSHILQMIIQKVYQDLHFANGTGRGAAGGATAVVPAKKGKPQNSAEANRRYSEICVNHNILCRKVIKQTVMTICYGVTRIGAIDQVEAKLKDIKRLEFMAPAELRGLAGYLAHKILSSISSIFSEAMAIKNWLDEISCVHNRFNVPVTWVSPVGLPCEQPYCKAVTRVVRTPLQAINVARYVSAVDKRRQKLAFPPNFVHSLDASHLMMTARRVFRHTESFAAVHDSYWIHPDNVDLMHRYIRAEFVDMHAQPILEELHAAVVGKLQVPFRPPPRKGAFDLDNVLDSTYFFH